MTCRMQPMGPAIHTTEALQGRTAGPGQDELQHDLLPDCAIGVGHQHCRALQALRAAAVGARTRRLRNRCAALALAVPLAQFWARCVKEDGTSVTALSQDSGPQKAHGLLLTTTHCNPPDLPSCAH